MESESSSEKEVWDKLHVWLWLRVSGYRALGLILVSIYSKRVLLKFVSVCIMNVARIGTIVVVDEADYTYTLSNFAIFSGLEIWLGIVAACVPLMKPLVTSFASGDTNRGSFKDRYRYWKFSRHSRSAETKSDGDAENWELSGNHLRSTFDKSRKPVIEQPDDDLLLLQNTDVPVHLGKSSTTINTVAPRTTPWRT